MTPASGPERAQAAASRRLILILAFAGAWMALAMTAGLASLNDAMGQDLNGELASGRVGERFDGFLEARDSSAGAMVQQINGKRRAVYEKRAQETGQSIQVVGQIYAKEIYQRARSGTWFLAQNGAWSQKP